MDGSQRNTPPTNETRARNDGPQSNDATQNKSPSRSGNFVGNLVGNLVDGMMDKIEGRLRDTLRSTSFVTPEQRSRLGKQFYEVKENFSPHLFAADAVSSLLPPRILSFARAAAYREAGCNIHPNVQFLGDITLAGAKDRASWFHAEDGVIIGRDVYFLLGADVILKKNVSIGQHSRFYTITHVLGFGSKRMGEKCFSKPIVVEEGAWLGNSCIVMPGVTIGKGAVVSACSVVTENVVPHTLVRGNPAVFVEDLPFKKR